MLKTKKPWPIAGASSLGQQFDETYNATNFDDIDIDKVKGALP
jgi:hypothetical protein